MARIAALRPDDVSLEVEWSDGVVSRYPWLWLRDHADGVDRVFAAGIPDAVRGLGCQLTDDHVGITWDILEPATNVQVALLRAHRAPRVARVAPDVPVTLWSGRSLSLPVLAHDVVAHTDAGVREWVRAVAQFGVCRITGVPATGTAGDAVLRRLGVEPTGGIHAPGDQVGQRSHTDGTSRSCAPGLYAQQVLDPADDGGECLLVDGFAIARRMEAEFADEFEVLCEAMVPGVRGSAMAVRPVFRHDHTGRLVQVTYNESERGVVLLGERDTLDLYAALRRFDEMANDPDLQFRISLAPGEILTVDNWRVLHGRAPGAVGQRVWVGYVDRDAMEARLRP